MGSNARRVPAARAAVGALVVVVATGLVGLGYAQATPQLTAPVLPAAPAAAPARPVERPPAAESDDLDSSDSDSGGTDSGVRDREAPGRLRAAAPRAPQPTPQHAQPPAESSQSAGSKPNGQPAPGGPSGGGPSPVAGTPCTATARACVNLDERLAWLIDGGNVVRGPVEIQHGDAEDPTPRGTFKVQWKAEQYTSREYLTQMPYSVFFADGGVAFHQGSQDTPSAGCVKLGHEDAEAFFHFLQVGDEVQIR
jgi:lipoprotein-anchoring transpeptidase ErfK/SrfK